MLMSPPKHIPELRHFIDAELAEQFAERIDARVAIASLPRDVIVAAGAWCGTCRS
ncbi:MAG: hypothetical protein WKF47_06360 [Geodermatophilaceae bacterium]